MKKLWHSSIAKVTGKNLPSAPKELVIDQMLEPRPLPMGRKEFEEWSDRIISGALISGGDEDPIAFIRSKKFALAEMIMHLGPTESHKPDAYFIHSLRKAAVNQVAWSFIDEVQKAKAAKLAAEKKAKNEALQKELAKEEILEKASNEASQTCV